MHILGLNEPWEVSLGTAIVLLAVWFFVWYASKIIKKKER